VTKYFEPLPREGSFTYYPSTRLNPLGVGMTVCVYPYLEMHTARPVGMQFHAEMPMIMAQPVYGFRVTKMKRTMSYEERQAWIASS
jgi:hypothetical protein